MITSKWCTLIQQSLDNSRVANPRLLAVFLAATASIHQSPFFILSISQHPKQLGVPCETRISPTCTPWHDTGCPGPFPPPLIHGKTQGSHFGPKWEAVRIMGLHNPSNKTLRWFCRLSSCSVKWRDQTNVPMSSSKQQTPQRPTSHFCLFPFLFLF